MKYNVYEVTLTNGKVFNSYRKQAFTEREAIILAQAEAIQNAKGYEFVSIIEVGKHNKNTS